MTPVKISLLFFLIISTFSCHTQNTDLVFEQDSVDIHYRIFGEGHPLLIINGGPGMNSDGFEGLAIDLSKYCKTILYDQRGTGKSRLTTIDTSTITMQLMIEDIENLRKQLHIESWSILGHSFGGMVASMYATQFPERIDKMILSSSGGIDLELLSYVRSSIDSRLSKTDLDSVNYWAAKIEDGDTSHYARLERGKHLAPAYVLNPKYLPTIAERLTQGNSEINQLMWANLRKIKFDCSEKLKSFDKPVLIIQGKEDIVRLETAEKAHRILSNSKLVIMDHCIHYGWLDNPEVYFKEVTDFLKS